MTTPLSPAARAIRNAFLKDADEDAILRLFQGHLADALRAAADQVVPDEPDYMRHAVPSTDWWDKHDQVRFELLELAAELGSTPITPLEENLDG